MCVPGLKSQKFTMSSLTPLGQLDQKLAKPSDVTTALAKLKDSALKSDNVLYPMKDALRANATLGEVSDVLREVFGVYQPS